jgi:ribose transport system ATP-binding protein
MLELMDINKSFSKVQVLFNVSTAIDENKVTAVIGENGAGKSTLMNIIAGAITDHTGRILLNGKEIIFRNTREARDNGISIIHQELNILQDLTAGENIFLGREPVKRGIIDYKKLFSDADRLLAQFNFPYPSNIKMRSLSVGWQQIVEIASALSLNANIFIMDEPTSALSDNETEILFERIRYLKDEGKTILFISHRISEVLRISDKIIVMRDGKISAELETKNTDREELIFHMAGKSIKNFKSSFYPGDRKEVLRFEDVYIKGGSTSLSGIRFSLHKGEVLGVAGLLGSGRTELLKFIFGEYGTKIKGTVYLKQKEYIPGSSDQSIKNKITYLPENRKEEGIFASHPLWFNAGISVLDKFKSNGLLSKRKELNVVEGKLDELKVKRSDINQEIRTLSGGNQQKVLLSRILLTEPEIILLDDPARGIDISSKEEIYQIIRSISSGGMSVIITSSEISELINLCSRILVLSKGHQAALVNAADNSVQSILNYAFKQF